MGFAHRVYIIATPLRLFARISEFYRQALGADPGYNGVLTHNPMRSAHRHGEFLTYWGRKQPYSLGELAEPIPKGWRLPVKPTTEAGRNDALLRVLMKWAGSLASSTDRTWSRGTRA